ncbi:MAG: glycoside hydrolase family 108 protein [Acidobacteriaceae bacterium]
MTDYERAFADIVGVEGAYSNDPQDPGGETKFGLSKHANPDLDIKSLTLEQAQGIYAERYWKRTSCDSLPWPLSLFVFDCAVNQGVNAAIGILQRAAGVSADGIIGAGTLIAIKRADQRELCAMFMALRALRYADMAEFSLYGKGWFKRLFVIALDAQLPGA